MWAAQLNPFSASEQTRQPEGHEGGLGGTSANMSRAGWVRAAPEDKAGTKASPQIEGKTEAFAEGAEALGGRLGHASRASPGARDVTPPL